MRAGRMDGVTSRCHRRTSEPWVSGAALPYLSYLATLKEDVVTPETPHGDRPEGEPRPGHVSPWACTQPSSYSLAGQSPYPVRYQLTPWEGSLALARGAEAKEKKRTVGGTSARQARQVCCATGPAFTLRKVTWDETNGWEATADEPRLKRDMSIEAGPDRGIPLTSYIYIYQSIEDIPTGLCCLLEWTSFLFVLEGPRSSWPGAGDWS